MPSECRQERAEHGHSLIQGPQLQSQSLSYLLSVSMRAEPWAGRSSLVLSTNLHYRAHPHRGPFLSPYQAP